MQTRCFWNILLHSVRKCWCWEESENVDLQRMSANWGTMFTLWTKLKKKITSFTVDHKRPFPFLPPKWMPFVFFGCRVSQETSSKGSSHRAFCLKRSNLTYPDSILVFWELLRIQFHHCRTFLWINIYFVYYCTCKRYSSFYVFWMINNNYSSTFKSKKLSLSYILFQIISTAYCQLQLLWGIKLEIWRNKICGWTGTNSSSSSFFSFDYR